MREGADLILARGDRGGAKIDYAFGRDLATLDTAGEIEGGEEAVGAREHFGDSSGGGGSVAQSDFCVMAGCAAARIFAARARPRSAHLLAFHGEGTERRQTPGRHGPG